MPNSTLKILPALMVAITAIWATQPVFGGAVHQFVLTETSSTSLAITYDGSPLIVSLDNNTPDHWTFRLPSGFVPGIQINGQIWTEPDNSTLGNAVDFGVAGSTFGSVGSDVDALNFDANADGTCVQVGTDGGVAVFATFHDLGDTATVPDTGTTGSLFGLSLMGLAVLRRKIPA